MNDNIKIFIAGHNGLVGNAIYRLFIKRNFTNLIIKSHSELDLERQLEVIKFFQFEKPDIVILAAAKVGGIHANNTYPAEFIYKNLQIECNVIDAAYRSGCKKLLFLGSSCIYPRDCPQPIKEEYLLTGPLEKTNDAYALAKIAGIKMCQAYRKQYGFDAISVMPTNLYGPGDNYHKENSHVIPALIRKFHEAKINNENAVKIWGTGNALREFLYVDDMADACIFLLMNYSDYKHINIGSGKECTITELAQRIANTVGFHGEILTDNSKPDGTPRKLMNSSKLFNMGWKPKISLEEGLKLTYQDFLSKINSNNLRSK